MRQQPARASSKRHYLGICAIAKDETPFLREWAAYYHLIGFERIFIYDNDSVVAIRDSVADMYDAGMLDTYTIQGENMQLTAYNHCLQTHGAECEWMAFFDLDEFLLLPEENDARAFCAGYEDFAGIAINSNNFSSSGHLRRPEGRGGLVIENYLESLGPVHMGKCIVRPALTTMPLSPEHFLFTEGHYAVNADKMPVFGGYAPRSDRALLNHYKFRSQQDYEEKVKRGYPIYIMPGVLRMEDFYAQASRPVTRETGILRHAARVRAIRESGKPDPYYAVDSGEIAAEAFPAGLARLAAALERDSGLARLVFLLGRRRFGDKAAYLALGCRACRACGDGENARRAALDLLAVAPALSSHLELFLASLLCGDRKEAERLSAFLLELAGREKDPALQKAVRDAWDGNLS
ncbi:MAG: glycosyltransferase family 92 protein [Deltaproteobacteria bacterium]|jgi:hypothetical protein|nr:glycosyltransferase family 92 protein [Deltaproteobacteria bacterium]